MKEQLLPYASPRQTAIDMLVFHCSAYDVATQIHWMHEYKVSAHYIIDEKGEIWRLVPETQAAYHAGIGYWRGEEASINQRSVGIELVNYSLGQQPYAIEQIEALIKLSQEIIKRYRIPAVNIVGHSDVAPQRKADPGRAFPWQYLAEKGIGLWPKTQAEMRKKNKIDISKLLAEIGYDTRSPEAVIASAWAFCRRFCPELVGMDKDIMHLVDNVVPQTNDFMSDSRFLSCLSAIAKIYSKNNY